MAIYFTSDLHLGHDKEFVYASRGFENIHQHDIAIIDNWVEMVNPDDIVYLLGDIMVGGDTDKSLDMISYLTGTIKLIRGNHDTDKKCMLLQDRFGIDISYCDVIKNKKWEFNLLHRPILMGEYKPEGEMPKKICIHGHTHSKNEFEWMQYLSYNVALDAHNCKVVSEDYIKERIRFYHHHKGVLEINNIN